MGRPWSYSVLVLALLLNAWPSEGEPLVRTLSVASHLSPGRREPLLVTRDDEPLAESVQPRVRRDTAGVDNTKITVSVQFSMFFQKNKYIRNFVT